MWKIILFSLSLLIIGVAFYFRLIWRNWSINRTLERIILNWCLLNGFNKNFFFDRYWFFYLFLDLFFWFNHLFNFRASVFFDCLYLVIRLNFIVFIFLMIDLNLLWLLFLFNDLLGFILLSKRWSLILFAFLLCRFFIFLR